MSNMSPEGNASNSGGTPVASGRSNASGAASRVTVDTRDLAKMKDLLVQNTAAAKKLGDMLAGMDPALKTLKSVNSELDKMRQLLGMTGSGGGSRSSAAGIGASNNKAGYVPQQVSMAGAAKQANGGTSSGPGSYSPQPNFGGLPGGQGSYKFGGMPKVNVGGMGDFAEAPTSYSGRARAYMGAPITDPKSQYTGMSRGRALGTELAASAITGAISFGGNYGTKMLQPSMDRSLVTNRLSIINGGRGSYNQQQAIGVGLTNALSANQGFGDITGAAQQLQAGGQGGSNLMRAASTSNWVAQQNPNLTAAQGVGIAQQITSVRSQNMLRGLGIRAAATNSKSVDSGASVDAFIKKYEAAAGHKLTPDEIQSGNIPGYGLYRSIVATFGDPSVIPVILNRWTQMNGGANASQGNMDQNLTTTAQKAASAVGGAQTAANPGVVKGQTAFLKTKTKAANAAKDIINASGATGQDAIAAAVGSGMILGSLGGISGILGRIEKILMGQAALGGGGGPGGGLARKGLSKLFKRGGGIAGEAAEAGELGEAAGLGVTAAGVGLAAGAAVAVAGAAGVTYLGTRALNMANANAATDRATRSNQGGLSAIYDRIKQWGLMLVPGFKEEYDALHAQEMAKITKEKAGSKGMEKAIGHAVSVLGALTMKYHNKSSTGTDASGNSTASTPSSVSQVSNPDTVLASALTAGAAKPTNSASGGVGQSNTAPAATSAAAASTAAVASAKARGKGPPKPGAGGPQVDTSGKGNVALAQKMAAARGWTGPQWDALYAVWNQESSFLTHAGSPNHAYGIPQADPGNIMHTAGGDWLNNPVTQIKWGLDYIKGRYPTGPVGALAHKHATDSNLGHHKHLDQPGGWYESGSWNIIKDQLSQLHKGEMVVPTKTANLLRTMVSSDTTHGQSRSHDASRRTVPVQIVFQVMGGGEAEARKHALKFADLVHDDHMIDLVAAGDR